jgi:hypothetical protein
MKKKVAIGSAVVLVVILGLALAVPALASPRATNTGAQVDTGGFTFTCGAPSGSRVIDVTERIVNDADSGEAGNYWGYDTILRHIQVWNTGPNAYCATVIYTGAFRAVAGQRSPGNTGVLTGDERGTFSGGYQSTHFTGNLYVSNSTNWPVRGEVHPEPVNYKCDIQGTCPGSIDWTTKYFSTTSGFDLAVWGWKYVATDHDGVWINASTGNSGDILDHD